MRARRRLQRRLDNALGCDWLGRLGVTVVTVTVILGLVLTRGPGGCHCHPGPSGPRRPGGGARELLVLSVPVYSGSTALEQLLMSSSNVTTLCRQGCWQCEARFTRGNSSAGCVKASHNRTFAEALKQWSSVWDLTRPVLFNKFGKAVDAGRLVRKTGSQDFIAAAVKEDMPPKMLAAGVTSLRLSIVQMWRPLCLANLSSHFRHLPFLSKEAARIADGARSHRAFRAAGVNVVLVSYADLLWRPRAVLQRLRSPDFLPGGLLDGINLEFVPRRGRDIFAGNQWKVHETLINYAAAHPAASLGYNLERRSCSNTTATAALSAAYFRAAAYLRHESDYRNHGIADD